MNTYTTTNIRKASGLELTRYVDKNGKKKFIIKSVGYLCWPWGATQKLNAILDPFCNRRLPSSEPQWKFRNLKEAEEHMALAILKGWNK